jgi:hypothetical protein
MMEQVMITLTGKGLQNLEVLKNSLATVSQIQIDAQTARRMVTRWAIDNVGNMLCGEEPSLINAGEKFYWRVPVWLGSTKEGMLGQVATIDVDTETGRLLVDDRLATEIQDHAQALSRPSPVAV